MMTRYLSLSGILCRKIHASNLLSCGYRTVNSRVQQTVEDILLSPEYDSHQYVEEYLKPHMRRFKVTLGLLKDISAPGMRVIDIGSYGSLVPTLKKVLGLEDIVITKPQ